MQKYLQTSLTTFQTRYKVYGKFDRFSCFTASFYYSFFGENGLSALTDRLKRVSFLCSSFPSIPVFNLALANVCVCVCVCVWAKPVVESRRRNIKTLSVAFVRNVTANCSSSL